MKRIVSGITATGKLTIGNYIGAIKNLIDLQNEYQLFVFVADLHALTIDINPSQLQKNRYDIFALYRALGLTKKNTTLFFQSHVKEHGQMNWILENQTTIGELSRMTQFKDKSSMTKEANGTEKIKTGLLTYPTLMAGDILLYKPDLIPVGEDQKQHIELTRNIVNRINNRFGKIFDEPKHLTPKIGGKILSLTNPEKKMSKSDEDIKGSIFLLDDPDEAYKKIQKAVTDSEGKIYISDKKPGISNLLIIYSSLTNQNILDVEKYFINKNYGELKNEVGNIVKSFLNNLQQKYEIEIKNVAKKAKKGAKIAKKFASQTLKELEIKIGLN